MKSIFLNNIPMNTIEKNNEDFSYRPRYYFVRGIPVTEDDRSHVHPLNSLNQNNSRGAKIGAQEFKDNRDLHACK
ncbi:MAG: hypothetical protein PHS93_09870 [Candidatus Omnitrophica bacterium]|nr:hypothetical protein [Candidatus Omnitrophota bacterium]